MRRFSRRPPFGTFKQLNNLLEIRGRNLLQRSDRREANEMLQGLAGISEQLLD